MTHLTACTSILVGKKASLDGSVMIARNDDTFHAVAPHRFTMYPAVQHQPGRQLTSYLNGFSMTLPENGYRFPGVPNVDIKRLGYYDESGINEKNVAMSATESTYGNEHTLAYDPLVPDGLDEDCIVRAVLPYIDSAREGVHYLGQLICQYGSPAGNSVLFADQDEAWYMEIVTGHHWIAQRIPDDAYAITANQVAIQAVDFSQPDDFMWSSGIQEFVTEHHLNPDFEGFNFRHIFGTDTEKDRHYNTPRVWYGQHLFSSEQPLGPESSELPFICYPTHKLSVDDLQTVLGSHYNETQYDPLGNAPDKERLRYRPIGLNRTQNSHVLQLRAHQPANQSALMWLCLGYPTFAPYLPFYANMESTPASFDTTDLTFNFGQAYWRYRALSVLVEAHYPQFRQANLDFIKEQRRQLHAWVAETDALSLNRTTPITAFLTQRNDQMAQQVAQQTESFMGELYTKGLELSALTFNMDKNL